MPVCVPFSQKSFLHQAKVLWAVIRIPIPSNIIAHKFKPDSLWTYWNDGSAYANRLVLGYTHEVFICGKKRDKERRNNAVSFNHQFPFKRFKNELLIGITNYLDIWI